MNEKFKQLKNVFFVFNKIIHILIFTKSFMKFSPSLKYPPNLVYSHCMHGSRVSMCRSVVKNIFRLNTHNEYWKTICIWLDIYIHIFINYILYALTLHITKGKAKYLFHQKMLYGKYCVYWVLALLAIYLLRFILLIQNNFTAAMPVNNIFFFFWIHFASTLLLARSIKIKIIIFRFGVSRHVLLTCVFVYSVSRVIFFYFRCVAACSAIQLTQSQWPLVALFSATSEKISDFH